VTRIPLWPWRWQTIIAFATVASGPTDRAGVAITSLAVTVVPTASARPWRRLLRVLARGPRAIAEAA
jgi:hypothetical protein